MKFNIIHIVLFFCFTQILFSQEDDGIVAFDLPIRNSLKFNKYAINPTFSFVREQNKYISFTNKREWVQFDNAPQSYLFSYSGRFRENIGIGLGFFQQNYGVLTTFGGIANFAYNATFDRESNLTFGMNLGFYNSGVNEGSVITNFSDPSLNNIPSNSLITINPGINYGTAFFDLGISINNLVAYNLTTSQIIEENPEQSIQAHVMYTGYFNTRGFFDESKFSGLFMSEFKKDKTILSGLIMLTVPKGIWAQAGYNTLYGVSAGLGLNVTSQISLEYNYEKSIGDLVFFGNSHEITLAYKFKNRYRYNYSGDDDEAAFIIPKSKPKRVSNNRKSVSKPKNVSNNNKVNEVKTNDIPVKNAEVSEKLIVEEKSNGELAEEERIKEELRLKQLEEQEAKVKANEILKTEQEEEQKQQKEAEAKAKLEAENKIKAEAKEKLLLEEKVKAKLLEVERLQEEERIKQLEEQEAKAKEAEELKLQNEAEAKARLEAENRIKAEAKAKLLEENKLKEEARINQIDEQEAVVKQAEELKEPKEAEAKAKLLEDERIQAETAAKLKKQVEQKIDTVKLEDASISLANDKQALALGKLSELTDITKTEQKDLLFKLKEKITIKQKDLDDLKEENDLSEQGVYSAPKAFKSVSAENAALASLQLELEDIIESQNSKISELENLYKERLKSVRDRKEETNVFYLTKIQDLKTEQLKTIKVKEELESTLENINVATEIERKRRIKRATYDNQEVRYLKDRATLNQIKQSTEVGITALEVEDFDFGEEQSNIQIVKNIKNTESGYYLVIAVHSDVNKRDEFLTKTVSSGQTDVDFFYDANTSKYFIYYKKFTDINNAKNAIDSKGVEPYNSKMSIVKIEN